MLGRDSLRSPLGIYGDPRRATRCQYDELRIEHDEGDVEIVVYYRAIPLFRTESEAVRRIHEGSVSSSTRRVTAQCEGSPGPSIIEGIREREVISPDEIRFAVLEADGRINVAVFGA